MYSERLLPFKFKSGCYDRTEARYAARARAALSLTQPPWQWQSGAATGRVRPANQKSNAFKRLDIRAFIKLNGLIQISDPAK